MPDVHLVWDGLPVWFELKVANSSAVKISPHQIAWNTAYWARGGSNFFLVKHPSTRSIVLFDGIMGPDLLEKGVNGTEGARFASPAALFEGLRPVLEARFSASLRLCDPAP